MRLLLDTHTLLWWFLGDPNLSPAAEAAIADPASTVFASAVSTFEIANKHRRGKLPGAIGVLDGFSKLLVDEEFQPLSLSVEHARLAGALEIDHKDPFDRMLIAQARIESLVLVSNETLFDSFGVSRLW